jgi:hypothetical protein
MIITEYADVLNVGIRINYYHNQDTRWSAAFENCETKEDITDPCLTGEYGNGHTPEEALYNYVQQIKGKVLVFNAMDENKKREYLAPNNLEVSKNNTFLNFPPGVR